MSKMILFVINKETLFYKNYKSHILTEVLYKELKWDWQKALRRLHLRLSLPCYAIWYSKEFKNAVKEGYDILMFDSILTVPAANYALFYGKGQRVIYWFWNHIFNDNQVSNLNENIEKWSYDEGDCVKYNLRFNHQFHFDKYCNYDNTNCTIDFFFIGSEKGRAEYINNIKAFINKHGLTYEFIVIDNNRQSREANWIEYDDIIKKILNSRCVVDIMPDGQRGLTLRPLEALFMKKKLLTNNKYIKEYPFYSPDNIFIFGENNKTDLNHFLQLEYDETVDAMINEYNFNHWISVFENKNKLI